VFCGAGAGQKSRVVLLYTGLEVGKGDDSDLRCA